MEADRLADARFNFATDLPRYVVQSQRRAHGPHRVVLVGCGDAEQGQYLIAHELVDHAAVGFDDARRLAFDAAHEGFDLLRVEALIERGVAGEIGKTTVAWRRSPDAAVEC